jgi:serine protease
VGDTVALSGNRSSANGNRTVVSYSWLVTAGAAQGTLSGATNTASASLVTKGVGPVTVSLTVTDSANVSSSTSVVVDVQAVPVTPPAPPPSTGGGGGGTTSPYWLLALGVAVAALFKGAARRV